MKERVFLAANTWVDLSIYYPAVGRKFLVRPDGKEKQGVNIEVALKATAPTVAGVVVAPDLSAEINIGQGTLKPWARTTNATGAYISLDGRGPEIVLVEPTTAVA